MTGTLATFADKDDRDREVGGKGVWAAKRCAGCRDWKDLRATSTFWPDKLTNRCGAKPRWPRRLPKGD